MSCPRAKESLTVELKFKSFLCLLSERWGFVGRDLSRVTLFFASVQKTLIDFFCDLCGSVTRTLFSKRKGKAEAVGR